MTSGQLSPMPLTAVVLQGVLLPVVDHIEAPLLNSSLLTSWTGYAAAQRSLLVA